MFSFWKKEETPKYFNYASAERLFEEQGNKEIAEEGVTWQLASDIHLEFSGTYEILPKIPVLASALALLGDIGYPNKKIYKQFLLEQASRFEHVLVIAGNHEYYNQENVDKANQDIEDICSEKDNLHFLNKSSVEIGNIVFLGCTLWPRIPEEYLQAVSYMCNDYRAIKLAPTDEDEEGQKKTLTPTITNEWHAEHVQWIADEVERIKQEQPDKKVVVLTHHAPSKYECTYPSSRGEIGEEIEYDNLEYLLGDPIIAWGFGHTHWSSDFIINGTRVVSNQSGYITMKLTIENGNVFDPKKVVDLAHTQAVLDFWHEMGCPEDENTPKQDTLQPFWDMINYFKSSNS